MTDAGNEFQTDGAAHRKERFAKLVRANGWMSNWHTSGESRNTNSYKNDKQSKDNQHFIYQHLRWCGTCQRVPTI